MNKIKNLDNFEEDVAKQFEEAGMFFGVVCDYFELGRWFESRMEDCEFELQDFYDEYAKEIEWRAEP